MGKKISILFLSVLLISILAATLSCSSSAFAITADQMISFYKDSPDYIAFQELQNSSNENPNGSGWSVSTSADGSVYIRTTPHILVNGGPHFTGVTNLFEGDNGKPSANFFSDYATDLLYGAASALSADGSLVVISAPGYTTRDPGYIFGYLRSKEGWKKEGFYPVWFRLPAQSPGASWGMDIDLSGDSGATVVVGAPGEKGVGKVWYFLEPKGGWTAAQNDLATGVLGAGDAQRGDKFGRSVAISRNDSTIVVGAPGRNERTGMVFIFKKPAEGWLKTTEHYPLTSPGGSPGDSFGQSVAVSKDGSVIVIGAPGAAAGTGAVYVVTGFTPSGQGKITSLQVKEEYHASGSAVDVSADGKTIAVGSLGIENGGSIQVFRSESGDWSDSVLVNEWYGNPDKESQRGSMLGFSLALTDDGSALYAGAPLLDNGSGEAMWFKVEK